MERNYIQQGWGHACSLKRKAGPEENSFTGHIFGHGISEGDTILLGMQSGKVGILKLEKLQRPGDPADLYFIDDAHFIGYKD